MKRDARLVRLSREHHHALVLARRAARGEVAIDELRRRFDAELEPHFAIEEARLLPSLVAIGGRAVVLAQRTAREHTEIRDAVLRGDLAVFGELLANHVRFEERELFPACEALLASDLLDAVMSA